MTKPTHPPTALTKVRIDKWLWAARFFRTRSLAKQAIEGGRVHCEGSRVKVSKEISVGTVLSIRQGSGGVVNEKTIVVQALSEQRGSASIAQTLYTETEASQAQRAFYATQRKLDNLARPDSKPNKKQRRQLHEWQGKY